MSPSLTCVSPTAVPPAPGMSCYVPGRKLLNIRMIIFGLRMKQYLKIRCLKYKEWNLETYELTFEILANTI